MVSIIGDGGMLFGVGELATAVQHGIGVVAVLFNNGAYGNVLRDQQTGFGGRLVGSELRNPDFQQLAASFGVAARRVDTAAGLEDALTGGAGGRSARLDRGDGRPGRRGLPLAVHPHQDVGNPKRGRRGARPR